MSTSNADDDTAPHAATAFEVTPNTIQDRRRAVRALLEHLTCATEHAEFLAEDLGLFIPPRL